MIREYDETFSELLSRVATEHLPRGLDCSCGWVQPKLSFWRAFWDCRMGYFERQLDHVLDMVAVDIDRRWP